MGACFQVGRVICAVPPQTSQNGTCSVSCLSPFQRRLEILRWVSVHLLWEAHQWREGGGCVAGRRGGVPPRRPAPDPAARAGAARARGPAPGGPALGPQAAQALLETQGCGGRAAEGVAELKAHPASAGRVETAVRGWQLPAGGAAQVRRRLRRV